MITKHEFELLNKHVMQDIRYGASGTFNMEDPNDGINVVFNEKESDRVIKILEKLKAEIMKRKTKTH